MTRIKFTFISGMALLALGTGVGLWLPSIIGHLRTITIDIPPALAQSLQVSFALFGILFACALAVRGIIVPRDWGKED